jgi:6,7-dimethyl-8-ribityllumazine synthase
VSEEAKPSWELDPFPGEGWPRRAQGPAEGMLSPADIGSPAPPSGEGQVLTTEVEAAAPPAQAEEARVGDELPLVEPPEHLAGELRIPDGYDLVQGGPHGFRRTVAVVVSRFNGEITSRMLESALQALGDCHVAKEQITIVPVPGAFELPLAALALAKTRRFSCIVALGCVIRGETPHFDYVASETASGLQLAAIESGIPVSFGVLTCDTREQAEARVGRAAAAARAALEMADLFSHVRTRAAAAR